MLLQAFHVWLMGPTVWGFNCSLTSLLGPAVRNTLRGGEGGRGGGEEEEEERKKKKTRHTRPSDSVELLLHKASRAPFVLSLQTAKQKFCLIVLSKRPPMKVRPWLCFSSIGLRYPRRRRRQRIIPRKPRSGFTFALFQLGLHLVHQEICWRPQHLLVRGIRHQCNRPPPNLHHHSPPPPPPRVQPCVRD